MTPLIISVATSLILSAVCSLSEAVLYAVPLSYIDVLRKKRGTVGKRLMELRENIDQPITVILALNTTANSAGALIGGSFAADVFDETGMIAFAIFFTTAILICSEILPKTIGVVYCRAIAPFIATPLFFLVRLFKPLLFLTGFITHLVMPKKHASPATADDIKALVSLSRSAGSIQAYEERIIRNILALDGRRVGDVMTPRPVVFTLSAISTAEEALHDKRFWNYSRIPVYGKDPEDIVGIVFRRDITEALAKNDTTRPIGNLMIDVHFVLETLPLDSMLSQFLKYRTHLYVVVDEYGGMAGVVSLEDVLEEILGREIVDETDRIPDHQKLARARQAALLRQLPARAAK